MNIDDKYPVSTSQFCEPYRFQAREFCGEYQVYGVGLKHVCICPDKETADMIVDALEKSYNSNESV